MARLGANHPETALVHEHIGTAQAQQSAVGPARQSLGAALAIYSACGHRHADRVRAALLAALS